MSVFSPIGSVSATSVSWGNGSTASEHHAMDVW
jgi:hypothetical protein